LHRKSTLYECLIYFISEVGTSLEQIESEIEKLCFYEIGENLINRNQIDAVVSKSTESNIFKMVDDISRKDASGAISILNALLFKKEEHLKILGMIIRQYRLLLMIKLNSNNKVSGDSIKSSLKLKDFTFQNMLKQSRMYDENSLKNALSKCLEVDSEIKTGRFNPELALEMLIVELCK
jgi:DNA polymerase-3 subunit delta